MYHERTIKARALLHAWYGKDTIEIDVWEQDGHALRAGHVEWKPVQPGDVRTSAFALRVEQAQALMDSLWECGLRPSQGAGSAGALQAVQDDLKHTRGLLAQVLPVALSKSGNGTEG